MDGGDKKKDDKLKLNLQASEFKPKTNLVNNQQNAFNPYMQYNNYNQQGGIYGNQMGQMGYDPNMYAMYGQNMNYGYQNYGNMQQDNNYMQQNNNYAQQGQYTNNINNSNNINTTSSISGMSNTNTNTNTTKKEVTQKGGIPGMSGAKVKVANTNNTNNTTKQGTNQTQNKQTTNTTNKPKEVAKTTVKDTKTKETVKTTTTKKEEVKTTNTSEIEKGVSDVTLDEEAVELVEDSKEGAMIEVDTKRQPCTVVFIGHVDHGKSTVSGNILLKTGQIDERTIEKYQREAKANNRESWWLAYIFDVNQEERERGKTVEVGKAFFSTPNKRFTILDAPGHAGFIPDMLQGACQADFAGLVISAKVGEFEGGFEADGRTREHALLAKSLGVSKLICIVNKMDEESVKWSQDRFEEIKKDISVFLKQCGFNLEKDVFWIPMSALHGDNLVDRVDSHKCPWYKGPTLLETLDSLETPSRNENAPLRIPILDRYKENGLHVLGKVESGTVKYGSTYTISPSKIQIEVGWLFNTEEKGVPYAKPGENVRVN